MKKEDYPFTTNPNPEISVYMPKANSLGIGLIIFPGGGYSVLADHEGQDYAEYFSKKGITCFVVRYRLATDGFVHPAMLEDALSAIARVREKADEYGIHKDRIGVMGSSAGGHLASHTMGSWPQYGEALQPNFGILCYPVITSDQSYWHSGSFQNVMGAAASQEKFDSVSTEKLVDKNVPPCFLWHTLEDKTVLSENSMLYAKALRDEGISHELHIYPKGNHGLGLKTPYAWEEQCLRWIKSLFPNQL
jgi:acetyl esterase/lipase